MIANEPPPLPRPRPKYGVKVVFVTYDRSRTDVWWWGPDHWVDERGDAARMHSGEAEELLERVVAVCRRRPDDGRMGSYSIERLDAAGDYGSPRFDSPERSESK